MRGIRILTMITLCLLSWAGAAYGLDRLGRRPPAADTYDAIVVAGCRVDPNGQPSLALQRRTRLAVQLYQEGRAPRVVFTGGVGTYPPSEASAAADYAATQGLPREAMILEERSTSTEENAQYAAELLADLQIPHARILVVTDTYHVYRASRVFGRRFAEVAGAGSTPSRSVRVRGALREVLAVAGYAVAGRL